MKRSILIVILALLIVFDFANAEDMSYVESFCDYDASLGTIMSYPIIDLDNEMYANLFVLSLDEEYYWGFISTDPNTLLSIDYQIEYAEPIMILHSLNNDNLSKFYYMPNSRLSSLEYKSIDPYVSDDPKIIMVQTLDDEISFINTDTERVVYTLPVEANVDDSCYFSNGYCCINMQASHCFIVIDNTGRLIRRFNGLLAASSVMNNGSIIVIDDRGLFGIRSIDDSVIVDNSYRHICEASDGCLAVCNDQNQWGVINTDGLEIIPCQFKLYRNNGFYFDFGRTLIRLEDGSWIILYKSGEINLLP